MFVVSSSFLPGASTHELVDPAAPSTPCAPIDCWSVDHAAEHLDVSRACIQALIRDGALPVYRFGPGSCYRVRVADLLGLLLPADPADHLADFGEAEQAAAGAEEVAP